MDPAQILLIAEMLFKLADKFGEIRGLYDRAKAGETIPDGELQAGMARIDAALEAWDKAAD